MTVSCAVDVLFLRAWLAEARVWLVADLVALLWLTMLHSAVQHTDGPAIPT